VRLAHKTASARGLGSFAFVVHGQFRGDSSSMWGFANYGPWPRATALSSQGYPHLASRLPSQWRWSAPTPRGWSSLARGARRSARS
jgi:hypothetical protein